LQGHRSWGQRLQAPALRRQVELFAAVALLWPRSLGKTSLALQIGRELLSHDLDLVHPADADSARGDGYQQRRRDPRRH
jgi:hypothetical protein